VVDEDERLVVRVDGRAVEGMVRDDGDVRGQMGFEGLYLGGFAGSVAADDGAEFGSCRKKTSNGMIC
jgi:hypothetical protein